MSLIRVGETHETFFSPGYSARETRTADSQAKRGIRRKQPICLLAFSSVPVSILALSSQPILFLRKPSSLP